MAKGLEPFWDSPPYSFCKSTLSSKWSINLIELQQGWFRKNNNNNCSCWHDKHIGLLTPILGICFPKNPKLVTSNHWGMNFTMNSFWFGVEQIMGGEPDDLEPNLLFSRLETEDLEPYVPSLPLSSLMSPLLRDLHGNCLWCTIKSVAPESQLGEGEASRPPASGGAEAIWVFSYVDPGTGSGAEADKSWVALHNEGREDCGGVIRRQRKVKGERAEPSWAAPPMAKAAAVGGFRAGVARRQGWGGWVRKWRRKIRGTKFQL